MPAEINVSLKIVSVASRWGIMYSIPGQALLFHFMFYPERLPMASLWRGRLRFSFGRQSYSQFMMYFMMPIWGAVTFNSLNCVVSSLDANFWPSVLLDIISESGVPVCEVYSTCTWGHVTNNHIPRVPLLPCISSVKVIIKIIINKPLRTEARGYFQMLRCLLDS